MSDMTQERFLSWKVSAETKDALECVMSEMKRQRGGRKVTQDEVAAQLLELRSALPKHDETLTDNVLTPTQLRDMLQSALTRQEEILGILAQVADAIAELGRQVSVHPRPTRQTFAAGRKRA